MKLDQSCREEIDTAITNFRIRVKGLTYQENIDIEENEFGDQIVAIISRHQESGKNLSVCCNAELISFKTYGYSECKDCGKTYRISDNTKST